MTRSETRPPKKTSSQVAEEAIAQLVATLRAAGNVVEEEVAFHPERRWRFDVVLRNATAHKTRGPIAIEIEGLHGRHQSIKGFINDVHKYTEATVLGWRVLRFIVRDVARGEALVALARMGVRVTVPRKRNRRCTTRTILFGACADHTHR